MPDHVPTAPSRILESHKDLQTFSSQLEHIRFLVLRMGGNVLSDRQAADTPQERSASASQGLPASRRWGLLRKR